MHNRLIARGMLTFALAALTVGAHAQTTLYIFRGDSTSDNFGFSVSGAGDVDGDGFADLIVGAPSDGDPGLRSGSARVFSGANGSTLYTFSGESAGERFGQSVSGAGDVNGDGFDDLIVAAVGDDINGFESGTVRVFSGADGSVLYTFSGDAAGDAFGFSVSGAGDVNADGYADFIVGAIGDDNTASASGSARVFSGFDGSVLYTFNGDSKFDSFGNSVSGAGDANADGFDDLIVGSFQDDNNGFQSGSARVFSGFDGSILYTFNGDDSRDSLGYSVSAAGDVDGDGYDDVIAGAYTDSDNGNQAGSARVFSGRTGSVLYTFFGDSEDDHFGFSVSGVGDVNADGYADLIVGALHDDNNLSGSGSARVFSGFDGSVLYTINGETERGFFGESVSGAGDVNGDGRPDFIVGTSVQIDRPPHGGSAYVILAPSVSAILLGNLLNDVVFLNLSVGLENSLNAKLDAAFLALNDMIDGNDQAAVVMLQTFIAQVQAQSANQIPVEDADALVALAQAIIDLLISS